MKIILLAFLFAASSLAAALADPPALSPAEALEADGTLALCDGSSYFVFSCAGTFHSFPVDGLSGRTFEGRWTTSPQSAGVFRVEAKSGWINGISTSDNYRIVFFVSSGHKKVLDRPYFGFNEKPKEVWDGYFSIDELSKVARTDAAFPWQPFTLQPGKVALVPSLP